MTAQPGRDEQSASLLPCPFCGGEPEIERSGTPRQSCIVICTDCNTKHESPDEGARSGESWNRRVPAPASGWRDEKPDSGGWWLRIHPERSPASWTVLCVYVDKINGVFTYDDDYLGKLSDERFIGAKWKRRETPQDPFAVAP